MLHFLISAATGDLCYLLNALILIIMRLVFSPTLWTALTQAAVLLLPYADITTNPKPSLDLVHSSSFKATLGNSVSYAVQDNEQLYLGEPPVAQVEKGDTIQIGGYQVTMIANLKDEKVWEVGYNENGGPRRGVAKFGIHQEEVAATIEASRRLRDYLYVAHDLQTRWLLMKFIDGELITSGEVMDSEDCTTIQKTALEAAINAQMELSEATGFSQQDHNPRNYIFQENFTKCQVVDLDTLHYFPADASEQHRRDYITPIMNKVWEGLLPLCNPQPEPSRSAGPISFWDSIE
ncbi:hypothetical protein BDN72DRAFT_961897 [Pluteus cervinus]|uniref:Uncharacterized protein n=1 Tax=Pluteus cervinus TaxID=181527 RepID=A0ACD3AL26_9AGAR|nr:hypothetical protein BDN72DRAFT_961897 [Pluteus cervinus]